MPRFQATLELGVCAMIFATAVGIPVGVLAAVKRGSIFDHTAVGLALTGYSMPIFWVGHDADHAGFGALEPDARLRSRERYGVPR
ncbi:dipeptide transporter permease DppB [Escherichia coli]|uniref:Dipeptide transporter permease DppB n=1 Tax=Escherichia coli TaxID=562 RepID=A0A377ANH0_ECOLX|nr:dipeptide transporter permease DppB [Escherichia coli]